MVGNISPMSGICCVAARSLKWSKPMKNGNDNDNDNDNGRMRRADALGILANLATRHDLTPEEVTAIQVAFRATAKRFFGFERWIKRKHAAQVAPGAQEATAKEGSAE